MAQKHARGARLICTVLLCAGAAMAAERGEEIRLWPNGAPGSEGAKEVFEPGNAKLPSRFTVVHYPSIYVFLPPKERRTVWRSSWRRAADIRNS